jgi:hypothetical protein
MKVVKLLALHTGPLYPLQETFLVLISVISLVEPRTIVRPKELRQRKNSIVIMGNQTRDLPACSAVPQPNAPPRVQIITVILLRN